ncbi:hypothetical protein SCA6_002246 [Theobroma cacao]
MVNERLQLCFDSKHNESMTFLEHLKEPEQIGSPSKDVKFFLLDQTLSWLALAVDFPQSGDILLIAFNLILCPTTIVRIDLATTNPKQNFKPLSFCLKWLKLPSSSLLKVKN